MSTPEALYNLAFRTKRRVAATEELTIASHGYCSELYARTIVKGRFASGEHSIAQDVQNASWYLHLTIAAKGQAAFNMVHHCLLAYNPDLEIRFVAEQFQNLDLSFLFDNGITVRLHDGEVWRTLLTKDRKMSFQVLRELGERYPVIQAKLTKFQYSGPREPVSEYN